MEFTTLEDVIEGEKVLMEVSKQLGLPIKYSVVEETHTFDYDFKGEFIKLERLVAKKWL